MENWSLMRVGHLREVVATGSLTEKLYLLVAKMVKIDTLFTTKTPKIYRGVPPPRLNNY